MSSAPSDMDRAELDRVGALSASGTDLSPKKVAIVFRTFPIKLTYGRSWNEAQELHGRTNHWHVEAALIKDPVTKATEINVETFKGTVQLSGFVESKDAMNQAVTLAENIKGVTSVNNDMQVK